MMLQKGRWQAIIRPRAESRKYKQTSNNNGKPPDSWSSEKINNQIK